MLLGLARAGGYGLAGALLAALAGVVLVASRLPELAVWHTAELDEEFVAGSPVHSFEQYLALEQRLFAQLEAEVLTRIGPDASHETNRFHRGSLSDPARWPRNWNRSFELRTRAPRAGVLLLHGLTDSPYSLRSVAERLHDAGAWVVGLRLPGHGTAPSGLTEVRWQDMAAAVRVAAQHLAGAVGNRPLILVGYSNGGALAVEYALAGLVDDTLARVERLVLLSPEIGISPAAALAVWQKRLGRLLGLEKLAWQSVLPEYNPFQYQSFATNAAEQAHLITRQIARRFDALAPTKRLADFPPTLAFQSAVDSTVSTPAVIEGLMEKLPANGHELVLFDLNRMSGIAPLLAFDPAEQLATLLRQRKLTFALSIVANRNPRVRDVVLHHLAAGSPEVVVSDLGLAWPRRVFSLSHVALPFPASDPLYGDGSGEPSPGLELGHLALRGESHVLQVSSGAMLRQRWNPFHPYLEARLLEFTGLD